MFNSEMIKVEAYVGQQNGAEFIAYFYANGKMHQIGDTHTTSTCRYYVYTGTLDECSEDPVGFAHTEEGVCNLLYTLDRYGVSAPYLIHDMKTHVEFERWY